MYLGGGEGHNSSLAVQNLPLLQCGLPEAVQAELVVIAEQKGLQAGSTNFEAWK